MLTSALCLACFAFGFWLCDRLKDRRAERAESKLRSLLSSSKKTTTPAA